MVLIVGLGNPGKEYEQTRHNAGFHAINFLQEKLKKTCQFHPWKMKKEWRAEISEGKFGEQKVMLMKPQTFMNRSGEAIQKVVNFYKIPLSNVWLIYDDVDLPLGTLRIRDKGSPGTHNGMRSVVACLGSENFPRFRLGVGEGSTRFKQGELEHWILSKFPKKDYMQFHIITAELSEAIIKRLQDR